MDDAIRISKYLNEYATTLGEFLGLSTKGSISVRINSNHEGNGNQNDNWIDFHTGGDGRMLACWLPCLLVCLLALLVGLRYYRCYLLGVGRPGSHGIRPPTPSRAVPGAGAWYYWFGCQHGVLSVHL